MLKQFRCKHDTNLTLFDLVLQLKRDNTSHTDEIAETNENIFNASFSFSGKYLSFTDLTKDDWGEI